MPVPKAAELWLKLHQLEFTDQNHLIHRFKSVMAVTPGGKYVDKSAHVLS